MSDALLPYYDRELDAIKRLAAEFADTHPKIAGRLRLSADAVDDPHVARLLEGVAFLAARVHHRLDDEFPELTDALLGLLYPHYLAPGAVLHGGAVRLPAGPDEPGAPARRHRDRHRTGARRGTALPHHLAGHAVAGRGGERPALRPADRGARQPIRRRRRRRAAHHAEMRLARGHLHPARRRPAALLPARPDQPDAGAVRAARRACHLDRLRRQRGRSGAGHRAGQRDRAGRLLARRGAAAVVGARLLRLPPADRILRLPGEVPVPRLHPDGHQDAGVRRQPAGDLRLSGPRRCRNWSAPSASRRWRSAARRWSTCSRSAASR